MDFNKLKVLLAILAVPLASCGPTSADSSKYRAVKDEQGKWTYEYIELFFIRPAT